MAIAHNSPAVSTDTVSQARPVPFALAFGALVLGALAMGISPVFVRFAEVGPFASAFWRVFLALPVLFAWGWWEARASDQPLRVLFRLDRAILLAGLLFAGDLFFWHLAIVNTTIANATFLACLAPLWVTLLSGLVLGEPVARSAYAGLACCLAGMLFLLGSSFQLSTDRVTGDLYGIITSFFFGLYFLAVRAARRRHGAGALTFLSTLITSAVLLAVTIWSGQSLIPATMAGVFALLALGFLSHAGGQGLLAVALGSLTAVFSSLVIFIEAIAAAVFGWLFLAEDLSAGQALGGLLIVTGIWIARPRDRS